MAPKKDYYEILGVPRNAAEKEIKAAYRRLARKHHPDFNPGNKAAEERFKEIAEAFAVLSDAEKRAKYDQGGHEAFGPGFDPFAGTGFDFQTFTFGDLSEIFGDFFGAGTRPRKRHAPRGQDIETEIRIPFVEAIRGSTVQLTLPRRASCLACGGSGVRAGTGEKTCPDCRGTGRRTQRRGGLQASLTCQRCQGAGRLPGEPCPSCGGEGRVALEDRVKVRIPPGIEDGGRVRLPGRGDAGAEGSDAGDAYLVVRVEPHPLIRREGRDLSCDVPIGLATAALGGKIEVPTLEGKATIEVPPGTRSGQRFRLRGRGVPASGSQPAGDLYAVIQIVPPERLDARSRELLEEFARLNPVP